MWQNIVLCLSRENNLVLRTAYEPLRYVQAIWIVIEMLQKMITQKLYELIKHTWMILGVIRGQSCCIQWCVQILWMDIEFHGVIGGTKLIAFSHLLYITKKQLIYSNLEILWVYQISIYLYSHWTFLDKQTTNEFIQDKSIIK